MDTTSLTVSAAPRMKADPVPAHTMHNINYWFGLHTTGTLAGKWRRFPNSTTLAPVGQTVGGEEFIFGYENERISGSRVTWAVKYRRDLISILGTVRTLWDESANESASVTEPRGDYYWLTEVSRQHWDGVL